MILGDVGTSITATTVQATIIHQLREALAAHVLDHAEVQRQRMLYAVPPNASEAGRHLQDHGVVALVGEPRTGRRITAINLLLRDDARLNEITLDPDDDIGSLVTEPGHGYLVNADDLRNQLAPKQRDALLRVLDAARGNCRVAIRATPAVWRSLGLAGRIPHVELLPADGLAIFRKHLSQQAAPDEAWQWSQREPIIDRLRNARPGDAVRMANIAAEVVRQGPRPVQGQLDDVVQAYGNWAKVLEEWFEGGEEPGSVPEGRRRSLLIATALLEGAHPAIVFRAADRLNSLLELPLEAGHGLVGPTAPDKTRAINADLVNDRMEFPRPAYGPSALDYVWWHWPQIHADLRAWVTQLPQALSPSDGARLAESVVGLAIRQLDPDLVTSAAGEWISDTRTNELGASALTLAGMSEDVGHAVRRKLYEWSRTTDPNRHQAVVKVCGGALGEAFPRMALTRLRHVADHGDDAAQTAVGGALVQLALIPRLRGQMLGEIVAWLPKDIRRGQRRAAQLAFLQLMTSASENGALTMLTEPVPNEMRVNILAEGWHEILRAEEEVKERARTVLWRWLEAAVQSISVRKIVFATLVAARRSEVDIGILVSIVFQWAKTAEGQTVIPRDEICEELLRLICGPSPFITSDSLAMVGDLTAEVIVDATVAE